jgi:porin
LLRLTCAALLGARVLATELTDPSSRDPLRESGAERDHLTGDWFGAREALVKRGVHLQFGYIGEGLANVSGGRERGAAVEGLGELALELELDRLISFWPGATLRVSSLWLRGEGPTRRLAGDALAASNIDGYDSLRLYECWLQQSLFADRISIRAGSLLADKEFAGTDGGSLLINSAFGWPAFISGNVRNTGPAFYVAAPGVRARVALDDRSHFLCGVFDGDAFDSASGNPRVSASGTHYTLNGRQGAFVLSELGRGWSHGPTNAPLAGAVKLGGWVHTGDFPDQRRAGRRHDANFGLYASLEQQFWCARGGDRCVGVFLRAGGSPPDRSACAFVIDGGIACTGVLPGRAADKLALGFIHADFSGTRSGYQAFAVYEQVVELTYVLAVRPWWNLQPDLQWISHPGGRAGAGHALLVGARSTVTF